MEGSSRGDGVVGDGSFEVVLDLVRENKSESSVVRSRDFKAAS